MYCWIGSRDFILRDQEATLILSATDYFILFILGTNSLRNLIFCQEIIESAWAVTDIYVFQLSRKKEH